MALFISWGHLNAHQQLCWNSSCTTGPGVSNHLHRQAHLGGTCPATPSLAARLLPTHFPEGLGSASRSLPTPSCTLSRWRLSDRKMDPKWQGNKGHHLPPPASVTRRSHRHVRNVPQGNRPLERRRSPIPILMRQRGHFSLPGPHS